MTLSTATITYNLTDLGVSAFNARQTRVWATTDTSVIVDSIGNRIHVGSAMGDIDDDGRGSLTVPVPGTGSNQWQTYIHLSYVDMGGRAAQKQVRLGPFSVPAGTVDLADLLRESAVASATGNGYVGAGDSLSSYDFTRNIPNWTKLIEAYTDGRAQLLSYGGISGNTSGQLLDRLQEDIIDPGPALVTVLIGTNDVPGVPKSTWQANVTAIHDQLRAAGITSVVCTIPPRNDVPAYLTTIADWNAWLHDFAASTNRPLLDLHAQVVDIGTGQLAAVYSHDGVHLNAAGHAAWGAYAARELAPLLPAFATLQPSSNVDPLNLVGNGLFLESAGGVPTGYTPSGAAVGVVETLVDDPDFIGKAWEWVFDGTDSPFRQLQRPLNEPGWEVGDTLRIQGRVKVLSSSGLAIGDGVTLPVVFDGAPSFAVQYAAEGIQAKTGLYFRDLVVPPGTHTIYYQPACVATTGQTITARVGDLFVVNLTALGLA